VTGADSSAAKRLTIVTMGQKDVASIDTVVTYGLITVSAFHSIDTIVAESFVAITAWVTDVITLGTGAIFALP
jgi:hypothetical protein